VSPTQLYKLSGLSLILGAVLSFVAGLLGAILFVGNDPTPYAGNALFVPINLISAAGGALLVLGLPGMYGRYAGGLGVVGLIGMLLIFVAGLMFGVFLNLFGALMVPYLAAHAPDAVKGNGPPSLLPFFIVGNVIFVLGDILLAIPMLRGRVQPRAIAYVLIGSAIFGAIGFLINFLNAPSNVAVSVLGTIAPLLLFVALSWLGLRMWSEEEGGEERVETTGSVQLPT
jgi:hypothetical protein